MILLDPNVRHYMARLPVSLNKTLQVTISAQGLSPQTFQIQTSSTTTLLSYFPTRIPNCYGFVENFLIKLPTF